MDGLTLLLILLALLAEGRLAINVAQIELLDRLEARVAFPDHPAIDH